MIDNAFAIWLRSALPELAGRAWAWDPTMVKGELQKPFATAALLSEPENQILIGDDARQLNTKLQVAVTAADYTTARTLGFKLRGALQAAKAYNPSGVLQPGIDFMIEHDALTDSGNQLIYTSGQPGWYAAPAPIIYSGSSVLAPALYSVNSNAGTITFLAPRTAGEDIRATYKAGIFDFTIGELTWGPITDIRNNLLRYNAIFTIDAWYYFKASAAKYI